MATWKAVERAIAAKVGGERVSARSLGQACPDVATAWADIECKHRKRLPQWLKDAMTQAVTNARPGKLPLVVLHERYPRHDDDLVMLRLADFLEYFGE
jgi:hypothetical protein